MNELSIRQKIYEIRGQRVMLDFDLADAYGVETSQLKRQVRRNMERFEGEDFMFEVTREELSRCQIGTLNKLEVTICDFKLGSYHKTYFCIYSIWSSYVE